VLVSRLPVIWLLAVVGVFTASGCTMPSQQLYLPQGQPTGSIGERAPARPTPLSGGNGDATSEPRAVVGDGVMTGQPNPKPFPRDAGRDGLTVNLVDASIPAAAKAVLGDILRLNYSVSDQVKGTVTMQSSQPVSKETLLETFEDILRSQGAALVADATGGYKILTLDAAIEQGAPIRARGATRRQPGMATEIVALQHVSAPEMERIVKSLLPSSIVLRADPVRNVLVVSGMRSDLAGVQDVVGVFDVDWMRGMSFALLPVGSADPDAIAQELDTVFANDREGPARGVVRFIGNRRLKAVLVISPRQDYLEKAEKWVRRLDQVNQEVQKRVHVYHVQNRAVQELAQLLQKVYASQEPARGTSAPGPSSGSGSAALALSGNGIGNGGSSSSASAGGGPQPLPLAVSGLPAPSSDGSQARPSATTATAPDSILPVANGPPENGTMRTGSLSSNIPDDRSSGIGIVADEKNNMLVITATSGEFKRMRQILSQIDVAPAQVQLEATIAEVTLTDQLKMGLRWYFETKNSGFKFTDSAAGAAGPVFPGFSYFLNAPNVKVAFQALSQITNVDVVSSPSLTVLDNHKAVLQVGDEVPVATQSAVGVIAPGAPIVNAITFRNTGIILNITPRVSDHGRVLLEIEQEVSDVVPTKSSSIDSPTIQQRRVRTVVAVNDGDSILLAGLIQDRATRARDQVPLIGEVPIVGNLFKKKSDDIKRTELLISITPRVIKDVHTLRGITSEFRDKLNFTTRPQRQGPPDRREQIDRVLR
jgi:general secretion pathway protein D